MARSSLSKPSSKSKLNLTRRQTALFAQIILLGNEMSKTLQLEHPLPKQKDRSKFRRRWDYLRLELAKELL